MAESSRLTFAVLATLGVLCSALPQLSLAEAVQTKADPAQPMLHLVFADEAGHPVHPTTACLTAIFWGGEHRVSLPVQGADTAIPMTLSWIEQQVKSADTLQHLYFAAEGYAPIRSNEFAWPGSGARVDGSPATKTIDLGRGARVELEAGKDLRLNVVFRKPGKRIQRFLDESGAPVPGVKFTHGPFKTNQNHCGAASAIEGYGRRVSDGEGRADIRDADLEYLIEVEKDKFGVVTPKPDPGSNPHIDIVIARLPAEETVVVLHRWARMPLQFQVLRDGKPVSKQRLSAMLAHCPCGACGGPLATSDENGKVSVADFYPEEYESIAFLDESSDRALWKITQAEMLSKGLPKTVELPVGK